MKILILGANGMLGHKLFNTLTNNFHLDVTGTIRNKVDLKYFSDQNKIIAGIKNIKDFTALFNMIKPNVIINCIGITRKNNASTSELIEMININSLLPHQLLLISKKYNARLIHISTDCVFSGKKGNYLETDYTDPLDEYGRSKLLGEFLDPNNLVIRTSIIGPELKTNRGLLEWFLSVNDNCNGYEKAIFSGLTTLELSKVIGEYIIPQTNIHGLINLSSEPISKAQLLKIINKVYKRGIKINCSNNYIINRSLNNEKFYQITKYLCPNWKVLISDMFLDQE